MSPFFQGSETNVPTYILSVLNSAELDIPSTYWGREGDLDIEYSLVFRKMSF